MDLPKRKQIRFDNIDYDRGTFHIVICLNNRECIFCDVVIGQGLCSCRLTDIGNVIETELINLPSRYPSVKIQKFCIMPNHIHIIMDINKTTPDFNIAIAGTSPEPKFNETAERQEQSPCPITCATILCAFKSLATKKANAVDNSPGRKIFQGRYYIRLIRDITEYINLCKYIDENPMKWVDDKYYCK